MVDNSKSGAFRGRCCLARVCHVERAGASWRLEPPTLTPAPAADRCYVVPSRQQPAPRATLIESSREKRVLRGNVSIVNGLGLDSLHVA